MDRYIRKEARDNEVYKSSGEFVRRDAIPPWFISLLYQYVSGRPAHAGSLIYGSVYFIFKEASDE